MPKPSKGFLFAVTMSFFWAMAIVNMRFLLNAGENPLNMTFWINLFMAVFWLPLFAKHFRELLSLSVKYKALLVVIAVSSSIGINLLQSLAIQNSPAVNFAFLYRTIVVFTVILAWIFFKEKITKGKIVLTVMILAGSYLLTTKGEGLVLTRGDIYTLLMALSAAFIANILIKHTISKMHPDLSGSVITFITVASLLAISLGTRSLTVPKNIPWIAIGGLIAFIQVATRNRAYKIASASFVTMIVSVTPVFVSILSYFLLNEKLETIQLVGGLLIVSSGFLVEKLKI